MIASVETVPRLKALPTSLPRENAVEIEVEEGVLVFRASKFVQDRIEELLKRQQAASLTETERNELDRYEEIDEYLSFLNRLTRNLADQNSKESESVS